MTSTGVVYFDGTCNLCNGLVRFAIANDPEARLRFAALQSPAGRALVRERFVDAAPDSIVLAEENRLYVESDAALRIAARLRAPWPLAFAAVLLPKCWRDAAYRFVARNRSTLFGKSDACMVPTPALRARFLPDGAGDETRTGP